MAVVLITFGDSETNPKRTTENPTGKNPIIETNPENNIIEAKNKYTELMDKAETFNINNEKSIGITPLSGDSIILGKKNCIILGKKNINDVKSYLLEHPELVQNNDVAEVSCMDNEKALLNIYSGNDYSVKSVIIKFSE